MATTARRLAGHLRTVAHLLGSLLRPPPAPPSELWEGRLRDPQTGPLRVTGRLTRAGGRGALIVLVHGLGGTADSPYLRHAARVAAELGLDTLRLNLRGADPSVGDFYHGGLTDEIHAAVADPSFASYPRIAVLAYSLGGHVALRWATEVVDPRVVGVAAVCAPLHLRAAATVFDRPSRAFHRYWVLRHLRRGFAELEAAGARLPHPSGRVRRAATFREWDRLTVVPRFGFADPDDYYARASAAPALARLRVPCLLVASQVDPLITPCAIEPFLPPEVEVSDVGELGRLSPAQASRPGLRLLWDGSAGHVAFPAALRLERRLLGWLTGPGRAGGPSAPER